MTSLCGKESTPERVPEGETVLGDDMENQGK